MSKMINSRAHLLTCHSMFSAGRTWMVSSSSPAQRLALEELDATIHGLHRRKWGKEERRGKEGDGEPRPRASRLI